METLQTETQTQLPQKGKLLRILGVTFGLAVVIGGTIGVGILRSPGAVAAQLGSVWLIILVWTLGSVESLGQLDILRQTSVFSQFTAFIPDKGLEL